MSLDLIVGPPNSGRATAVLDRLRSRLDADPLLVVPTGEDIARFERDLCADGAPSIGATIRTFASLFDEIATATAVSSPPLLTPPQRLALVSAAISATQLRVLRRSSLSRGFAPALDSLIAELQAAMVSPRDLTAAAEDEGGGAQETELATLYAAYERLRGGAGRADAGSVASHALVALHASPQAWGERPVLVYGFDDLTEVQRALVTELARIADVTVALNYSDQEALAARATLRARLEADGGDVSQTLRFDPSYTREPALSHLSAQLFEPDAGEVDPGDAIRLLGSGGERGEAEAVGIDIGRKLASGTAPDDITIVLRNPAADGPLFAAVLRGLGIPASLEAQLPLPGTAVGRSLIALCRAAGPEGEPADVLAHLRSDTGERPGRPDWAERRVARGEIDTVAGLIEHWTEGGPPHLARVFGADGATDRVRAVASCARRIAESAHRHNAPLVGARSAGVPMDPVELRAAITAAELLEELAAVASLPGCDAPGMDEAAEALESATVRSWQGSAEGRVRIVSPYRARAGTAKHLYCCGMQEGVFPGRGMVDPLLGEEARARLGIAALRRGEQDQEERYLFHVCVSRPTESLIVSWRSSDDEGHPAARSPFVDEVLDLLEGDPGETEERITSKRGLARAVPAPSEATSARTLARALTAAVGPGVEDQRSALESLGTDMAVTGDVLGLSASIRDPDWRPGPLRHPAVIEAIQARKSLSAGSLEGWIQCSYRWFVSHELRPRRLEPDPDPLWLGGLVHDALHELYSEPPGDHALPREGDVAVWKARFNELLDERLAAPERESEPTPDRRLALARVRIQVEAFLEEEAARVTDLRPRPDLLERSFGFPDSDGDPGALDLGDFSLRGFIDRIDVAPDGKRALIRDYKTSKSVAGRRKIADEGKLQLPLYMLVARDLLGLDPIAGLYHPLAAYGDRRGRGIALAEEIEEGGLLEREGIVTRGKDHVPAEEFNDELEAARTKAIEYGQKMRSGDVRRNPLGKKCPRYCEYQPICRLERALGLEEEFQASDE